MIDKLVYQTDTPSTLVETDFSYEFEEMGKHRPLPLTRCDASQGLRTIVENKRVAGTAATLSKYAYRYDDLNQRTDVVSTGDAFTSYGSGNHLFLWDYDDTTDGYYRGELNAADRHAGTDPDSPGSKLSPGDWDYAYDNIGNP